MGCNTGRCSTCPSAEGLGIQLGLDTDGFDHVVALAGNPNTGKSTVFNALTGLKQHTGNWPGKTVTRAEGGFAYRDQRYKLVDLPGTYSLLSTSSDEEVARDFLLFGRPDAVLVVVDATCLQRNLNLVYQIMEITPNVLVCLNLIDEARRKGLRIDTAALADELGVPVVATAARRRQGLHQLTETLVDLIDGRIQPHPNLPQAPAELQQALDRILPVVEQLAPGLPAKRWVAYRLLEGDARIRAALETGALAELAAGFTPSEFDQYATTTPAQQPHALTISAGGPA